MSTPRERAEALVTEALKHGLRPEDRERALEQWTRQIEQEDRDAIRPRRKQLMRGRLA